MWKESGLKGVEQYWIAFFQSEPDGQIKIVLNTDHVKLNIENCPAIRHLRLHNRDIVPCFCQQCYYINTAIAKSANLTVRVKGGSGQCQQFFYTQQSSPPPQDISLIKEVTC
jgi:hypothetical protein